MTKYATNSPSDFAQICAKNTEKANVEYQAFFGISLMRRLVSIGCYPCVRSMFCPSVTITDSRKRTFSFWGAETRKSVILCHFSGCASAAAAAAAFCHDDDDGVDEQPRNGSGLRA